VGGLRPVMGAQVERMALPAARREVAEEPFPDPRSRELAMDEQKRLPSGAALRKPALDVQASVVELDLVLADRPATLEMGTQRHRFAGHHPVPPDDTPGAVMKRIGSPFMRVDQQSAEGFGEEVRR